MFGNYLSLCSRLLTQVHVPILLIEHDGAIALILGVRFRLLFRFFNGYEGQPSEGSEIGPRDVRSRVALRPKHRRRIDTVGRALQHVQDVPTAML